MSNKIESYSERLRNSFLAEEKAKESLRLKEIELNLFKEKVIKEFIESEKKNKKSNKLGKIIGIFKTKK
tara:strand:- start:122 stop:328 length:207 start_codon:yes stop_codon:yes gene_type:complete